MNKVCQKRVIEEEKKSFTNRRRLDRDYRTQQKCTLKTIGVESTRNVRAFVVVVVGVVGVVAIVVIVGTARRSLLVACIRSIDQANDIVGRSIEQTTNKR